MFNLRQPHGAADSYGGPDVVAHPQVYSMNTSSHVYDIVQIFTLCTDQGGEKWNGKMIPDNITHNNPAEWQNGDSGSNTASICLNKWPRKAGGRE